MTERQKLLIDCDPGHDDAVAILVGYRHFDLLAVTTVHGNSPLTNTTRNALAVMELAGIEGVPVAAGAASPLVGEAPNAAHVHGKSGLDGHDLPPPSMKVIPDHAVDVIIETARAHQGELVLSVIGPATNIALALLKEPRLACWVKEVTVMGGSAGGGNITPAAEFNTYCDPEGLAAILAAKWPVRMVGYDVTSTVGIDLPNIERLRASGKRTAMVIADLLQFYRQSQRIRNGIQHAPMHDACSLIPLLDPTCMGYAETRVEVELQGKHTRGMTVCDMRGGEVKNPNARVAINPDRERLVGHMMDTVLSYD
ncbi:MAG: nucleoside hydrolase [Alphaproteobacteria bacterium]|jgi:inosine-uridine nucleoside N-ribohydrolase